jgi:glycosyltransferase involved in cell wall biosynthesis
MNASDLLLLTSFSEGSPQVVKEAIACTLPVISTPVGDVVKISEETDGVTIIPYDARKIAEQIDLFFSKKYRIQNNKIVEKYDNKIVAQKITDLYKEVLNNQQ